MDFPEKLSVYVRRIMAEKDLTFADIEKRSRKLITGGYVGDIISEKTTNPSVNKLKALARGLGVSDDEIFDVARGVDPKKRGKYGDPLLDNLFQKYAQLNKERRELLQPTLMMLENYIDKLLVEQIEEEERSKPTVKKKSKAG